MCKCKKEEKEKKHYIIRTDNKIKSHSSGGRILMLDINKFKKKYFNLILTVTEWYYNSVAFEIKKSSYSIFSVQNYNCT